MRPFTSLQALVALQTAAVASGGMQRCAVRVLQEW